MQKMNAEDDTFRPGDLVRWIGEWPFPLVNSPPRENTVLAIRSDGNVELEGRHGNEAPQRWSCPPDQLVRHDAACAASQDEPVQDEDELPQCSACGETCHWNDEADRDDIDGVLCNPCAQRIASEFLADDARLRAAPGDLVEAADALRAELEASIHKSPPRGLALLLRYAAGYLATELRHALAAKLRVAAKQAAAWEEAAIREWEPLASDYHDGDGTVTSEIEGPYIEHRLVMAWRGQVQRMADNLGADVPEKAPVEHDEASAPKSPPRGLALLRKASSSDIQRLDYSKLPRGYGITKGCGWWPHTGGELLREDESYETADDATAAIWTHYKAHNDPPGLVIQWFQGRNGGEWTASNAQWIVYTCRHESRNTGRPEARAAAWAWYDRRLALAGQWRRAYEADGDSRVLAAVRYIGSGDTMEFDDWWPRILTWSDEQVAAVKRWLADPSAELPEVLRG